MAFGEGVIVDVVSATRYESVLPLFVCQQLRLFD